MSFQSFFSDEEKGKGGCFFLTAGTTGKMKQTFSAKHQRRPHHPRPIGFLQPHYYTSTQAYREAMELQPPEFRARHFIWAEDNF